MKPNITDFLKRNYSFRRLISVFLFSGIICSTSQAETLRFDQLTWTEINQKLREGTSNIILPIGGTEQSGPFIAVGKHTERVSILSEKIAETVGHTLVAPPIAFVPEGKTNPRTSHMRFPGTISIPPSVFSELITSTTESFCVQGFKNIFLIGDHGGYQKQLQSISHNFNQKYNYGNCRLIYIPDYYQATQQPFDLLLKQQGYGNAIGQHADIKDTSLMLATNPEFVRLNNLHQATRFDPSMGIYGGNPRQASKTLGEAGITLQIKATVTAIKNSLNSASFKEKGK